MKNYIKTIDCGAVRLVSQELQTVFRILEENMDKPLSAELRKTVDECLETLEEQLDILYSFANNLYRIPNVVDDFFWGFTKFERCIQFLNDAIETIKKEEFYCQKDSVLGNIAACSGVLELCVDEELEPYITHQLIKQGIRVNNYIKIFDEHKSFEELFNEMMNSAIKAEKLFFSLINNPENGTMILSSDLRREMYHPQKIPIDIQTINGRQIISAYKNAILESVKHLDLGTIKTTKELFQATSWKKHGKVAPSGAHLSFFKGFVPYARTPDRPLKHSLQFKPVLKQLGNLHLKGVGDYGKTKEKDILAVINSLTGELQERESMLAKLFICFKQGNAQALSESSLNSHGFLLPRGKPERRKKIIQIYRIAFLVCFFEEARRNNGEHLPYFPFSAAISCALLLISDGSLRMRDVFDKNSDFGVFTGNSVMGKNIGDTFSKFKALFDFFLNKNREDLDNVFDMLGEEYPEDRIKWIPTTNYYYGIFSHVNQPSEQIVINCTECLSDDEVEDDYINVTCG